MKSVTYELKGFIVKNPPPLLLSILKIRKLYEPYIQSWIKSVIYNEAMKLDTEIMTKNGE